MNRKVITLGLVIMFMSASYPIKAVANTEQEATMQIEQRENKFPDVGLGIQWLSSFYGKHLKNNGEGYSLGKDVMIYSLEVKNSFGDLKMEPQVISTTPLWAGQSDLDNDTDREQSLRSTEFKKVHLNKSTTTTQNGFKLGVDTEAKVGIPFVAEGKVTVKTEYNFHKSEGYETSDSVEYIAPSQTIQVPPHTIARVTALLDVKKIKGTMNLYSEIGLNAGYGYDKIPLVPRFGGPLKYVTLDELYDGGYKQAQIDMGNNIPEEIETVSKSSNPNHLLAKGLGNFESEYGSVFNVKVEYINKKTRKIEKTNWFSIDPIKNQGDKKL